MCAAAAAPSPCPAPEARQRDRDRDHAADRHLQQTIERRFDRTLAEQALNQEHDRGSERGDAKARIDRRRLERDEI
jgi:hypothetical protein